MSQRTLKTALVQHSCSKDATANRAASVAGVRDAAAQGAQLVLLQELHSHEYFCQTEDTRHFELAEPIPGKTTEIFSRLAAELKLVIVTSVFEKRASGLYHNTAVVFESNGSIAGMYRKMHIPDDPGYYEKFYFTPGDLGFTPIQTSVGKLGVMICWDQWFPEAARLMALGGAELLLYPTAIGWDPDDDHDEQQRQRDAWMTVQRGHAIANGLPVMVCNRVGFEPDPGNATHGAQFWGTSFVCGPQGEILAAAADNTDSVLVTDIDLGRCEQVRQDWPFLRDRRIDCYDHITQRYIDAADK